MDCDLIDLNLSLGVKQKHNSHDNDDDDDDGSTLTLSLSSQRSPSRLKEDVNYAIIEDARRGASTLDLTLWMWHDDSKWDLEVLVSYCWILKHVFIAPSFNVTLLVLYSTLGFCLSLCYWIQAKYYLLQFITWVCEVLAQWFSLMWIHILCSISIYVRELKISYFFLTMPFNIFTYQLLKLIKLFIRISKYLNRQPLKIQIIYVWSSKPHWKSWDLSLCVWLSKLLGLFFFPKKMTKWTWEKDDHGEPFGNCVWTYS